jgi:hypothetical protein
MSRMNQRLLLGIVLVIAGVLFLLQNLEVLPIGPFVWAILFAGIGAIFIGIYLKDRDNWWAVIPGLALLALAAITALTAYAPALAGPWIGGLFLLAIGAAFWVAYFRNRANWWAIIPAGTLTTLALVAAMAPLLGGLASGGLLFLGLAVTFGIVGIVDSPNGHMKWAFIPAGILLLMGLSVSLAAMSIANYIIPIALLGIGVYLVWRAMAYRRI